MGLWDHIKPAVVAPVPAAIERAEGGLDIAWSDGVKTRASFRELRLGCPCAACVEEWSGRRTVDPAAIAPDIAVTVVDSVGNYALSLTFSDGHTTGIYSWSTLRGLGQVLE